MPDRLSEDLDRWLAAGLIDQERAGAIRAFEAQRAPRSDQGAISIVEVIAYAGAVLALAGIGVFYGTQYTALGSLGRLGLLVVVLAGSLLAGVLLGTQSDRAPLRRARSVGFTVTVLAAGILAAQVQIELQGGDLARLSSQAAGRLTLVAALVAMLAAGGFLRMTGATVLGLAFAVAVLAAVEALIQWQSLTGPAAITAAWAAGGTLILAQAEWNRSLHRTWPAETSAAIGLAVPILAALVSSTNADQALQAGAGIAALAGFAVAVWRSSGGYAVAGSIGLFATILDVEVRYFQSSVGFPVVLITSGLALLGIAFLLARMLTRLGRRRASDVRA